MMIIMMDIYVLVLLWCGTKHKRCLLILMVNCYHCLTGNTEERKDEILKSHDDYFHTGQKPRLAEGTDCHN